VTARVPLSVFMITRNEADRLGETLRTLNTLADEIIVVDSGSTDGTQAIAAAEGAKVIHQEWLGYGAQKRFAERQCRNAHVLNLDADERISPELAAEIRALFAAGPPGVEAFRLRIAEVFPGEAAPHPLAYALRPVRLYHRDAGSYSLSPVHDRVELLPGARVRTLHGLVHHVSVRSIGDQIRKLNAYTDAQVDDLAARGIVLPAYRIVVEFPAAFIKAYILRRHALRGLYGIITAMNYAYFRFLRVAKAYERRRLEARTTPGPQ
jgi:glycosyltransferase involved in cell wall biosynthesis